MWHDIMSNTVIAVDPPVKLMPHAEWQGTEIRTVHKITPVHPNAPQPGDCATLSDSPLITLALHVLLQMNVLASMLKMRMAEVVLDAPPPSLRFRFRLCISTLCCTDSQTTSPSNMFTNDGNLPKLQFWFPDRLTWSMCGPNILDRASLLDPRIIATPMGKSIDAERARNRSFATRAIKVSQEKRNKRMVELEH